MPNKTPLEQLEEHITDRIKRFTEKNKQSQITRTCSLDGGSEKITTRIKELLKTEFIDDRQITIAEVLWHIEMHDYEQED